MLDAIFAELPNHYIKHAFATPTSFYFSIDETKKTVICTPDDCSVFDGPSGEAANCVCKTSTKLFLRIWQEGYRPGMGDFLAGAIKSNAPQMLQQFMQAFGKS